MKDFIPDAPFNQYDEPIGDKRWWYHELYRRSNWVWNGPEADIYSPHTRTEEAEIEKALLAGVITPRNEKESLYLDFMGGISKMAERPKKWCICRNCGVEWQVTGFPAGKKLVSLSTTLKGEKVSGYQGRWLFPNLCIPCDDHLFPKRIPKSKPPKNRLPSADP